MEHTIPKQSSLVKQGGHLVINGRPCKVMAVTTAKTGKHGGAKNHFQAMDIFTGKFTAHMCCTTDRVDVPVVRKDVYTLMAVQDGFMSLLDASGGVKETLRVPRNPLGDDILTAYEDDREVTVTVLSAMGEEMVHSFRCE